MSFDAGLFAAVGGLCPRPTMVDGGTLGAGGLLDRFVSNVADESCECRQRGVLTLAQTVREEGGHAADCDRCCTSWLYCS